MIVNSILEFMNQFIVYILDYIFSSKAFLYLSCKLESKPLLKLILISYFKYLSIKSVLYDILFAIDNYLSFTKKFYLVKIIDILSSNKQNKNDFTFFMFMYSIIIMLNYTISKFNLNLRESYLSNSDKMKLDNCKLILNKDMKFFIVNKKKYKQFINEGFSQFNIFTLTYFSLHITKIVSLYYMFEFLYEVSFTLLFIKIGVTIFIYYSYLNRKFGINNRFRSQDILTPFKNFFTIKAFSTEHKAFNEINRLIIKNEKKTKNQSNEESDQLINFLTLITQIIELYYIGTAILEDQIHYSKFVLYQSLKNDVLLVDITGIIDKFRCQYKIALEMYEIYSFKSDVVPGKGKVVEKINGDIEFKSVYFSYPNIPEPIIKDLNFKIKRGTKVGIVGPSGGGKSTIGYLLLRLYDPQQGQIIIDGDDYKEFEINSIHKRIGYVSQETCIFPGTLLTNITYGVDEYSKERLNEIIKYCKIDEILTKANFTEKGLETKLESDEISNLSTGQKQRIAIARCLIKDCDIFIFDEATASLDGENESIIQESIDKIIEKYNITTFVIAHRINTIKNCDKIFVIKDGMLVENGNHNELINIDKGFYKQLIDIHLNSIKTLEKVNRGIKD